MISYTGYPAGLTDIKVSKTNFFIKWWGFFLYERRLKRKNQV